MAMNFLPGDIIGGINLNIHETATIGFDGFSFTRDPKTLRLTRNRHRGRVVLGDNVEIGALTNIDRGSYRDTVVGSGTKIDAHVHIGHNAVIGKNCIIVAGTVVGGSAEIGDCCWLGMNCSIKDHVKVGNNVIVGAGAVVLKDVLERDIIAGVPAKSIIGKHNLTDEELFFMAGLPSETNK